jgi:hypothetical protein
MNFASRRWRSLVIARSWAALFPLAAVGCTDAADELTGSVHAEYWRPNVAGEVSITKGSKAGTATPISLRRDLGLDHDDTPVLGADLDLGRNRLSFEYLDLSLHGSTTTPDGFVFHAQSYPAGDPITSDLKVPTLRVNWSYALWKEGASAWRAGLGGRFWKFDLQVADPVAGLNERRDFNHFYPLAVTDLALDLTHGFFARLAGNVAALSTSQAVYEADAALGWNAEKHFGAELGWRFLRYDFNESTNDGDFNLSGPYIALRFLF